MIDAMRIIYGLCEPGTEFVRYVGYTKRTPEHRLISHIHEAKKRMTCHRHHWIRSLIRRGLIPAIVVLEQVTSGNWKSRERYWIAKLRLTNNLVNNTDGGEGLTNPSKEIRERIAQKCRVISTGNQYALGLRHTEDSKNKISRGVLAAWKNNPNMRNRKPPTFTKETREGLRVFKNSMWISRGKESRRLKAGESIPKGWKPGRVALSGNSFWALSSRLHMNQNAISN